MGVTDTGLVSRRRGVVFCQPTLPTLKLEAQLCPSTTTSHCNSSTSFCHGHSTHHRTHTITTKPIRLSQLRNTEVRRGGMGAVVVSVHDRKMWTSYSGTLLLMGRVELLALKLVKLVDKNTNATPSTNEPRVGYAHLTRLAVVFYFTS